MRCDLVFLVALVAADLALLGSRCEGAVAPAVVKLCGRKLGDVMSRVCQAYNSPAWVKPSVLEQPAAVVRRRRGASVGIADQCCQRGCTWRQLAEYCAVSSNSESLFTVSEHMIEDRSAEPESSVLVESRLGVVGGVGAQAVMGLETRGGSVEVGGARRRGYGRARVRARARARQCWCRRKRRDGRHRSSLMGNMGLVRNVARAAPVVGTVSPLLTWGRTLHTDLPPVERDRYAYVAVYAQP